MKPVMSDKYLFKRHLCIENIFIEESDNEMLPIIRCVKCKREIGCIYFNGIEWRAFAHVKYKKYKLEIERWIYEYTKDRKNLGYTYEQDWEEMLYDHKQWCENNLFFMGCEEWDGECEEDSEGCESDGTGEGHQNVEDKLYLK